VPFLSSAEQRSARPDKKTRRPNVAVFMTDDQRHDAMSVAGACGICLRPGERLAKTASTVLIPTLLTHSEW
jgi:hypothetical protein